MAVGEREKRLRAQAAGGGGLVAYLGEEPVGWCAVGPRPGFLRLTQAQTVVPWAGRSEDKADEGSGGGLLRDAGGVRRRGVMRALAAASVGFARGAGGAGGRGVSDGAGGRAGRDLGGDECRGGGGVRGGGV